MSDEENNEETDETPTNGNGHDADEEDLVELALEELADRARNALTAETIDGDGFERSMVLAQFVIAADVHMLIEEVVSAIESAKATFAAMSPLAGMAAAAGGAAAGMAATPPFVEQQDGPGGMAGLSPLGQPAPETGASWVKEVLAQAESQAQFPAGKKTIAIDIRCADHQAAGPEHVALLERMRTEGWQIGELNSHLAKCERPAQARIITDPAVTG